MIGRRELITYIGLGVFGVLGPYLFPNYTLSKMIEPLSIG